MRWLPLLFLAACSSARAPANDEGAIAHVLDDWHDAAARADEPRYFGHFAQGAVFLGTDATERWDLAAFRAYAHPHFAKGKAWTMIPSNRHVVVRGDVAWFDEAIDSKSVGAARGSGVLLREDGRWKIAHYNLTVTVPNERMKEVKELLLK
jgi:ketosteroid isomerase-like protein